MEFLFVIPKYCSENNFIVVMHMRNLPLACMNPLLEKLSTRVVNCHSNILRYRKFSHNILCGILCIILGILECFIRVLQRRKLKNFEQLHSLSKSAVPNLRKPWNSLNALLVRDKMFYFFTCLGDPPGRFQRPTFGSRPTGWKTLV